MFEKNTAFKTVATFDMMPDAHIAMGKLKSEGIPCFLQDENIVQTDWLYSIAVGGIKLRVKTPDYEQALNILQRDDSDYLSELF